MRPTRLVKKRKERSVPIKKAKEWRRSAEGGREK
jgi:hypothetical protein